MFAVWNGSKRTLNATVVTRIMLQSLGNLQDRGVSNHFYVHQKHLDCFIGLFPSLVRSNVSLKSFVQNSPWVFSGHLKQNDFRNRIGRQGLMELFECDSEDELRSKLTGKSCKW